MKRYMAILGFVFVGVLAGLLVRGIPIVVQVNAGGEAVATQNGDVNGDSMLDMSDAVYLLIHLFNGGPQPAAFAQAEPADLRALEGSMNRIADSLDNLVAIELTRGDPLDRIADAFEAQAAVECEQSLERFVNQDDGTIIDTCKNLMWVDHNILSENMGGPGNLTTVTAFVDDIEYAGYSDWRMPTIEELRTLRAEEPHASFPGSSIRLPFYLLGTRDEDKLIWSSFVEQVSSPDGDSIFLFLDLRSNQGIIGRRGCSTRPRDCSSTAYAVIPVRDIDPAE